MICPECGAWETLDGYDRCAACIVGDSDEVDEPNGDD